MKAINIEKFDNTPAKHKGMEEMQGDMAEVNNLCEKLKKVFESYVDFRTNPKN